MNTLLNIGVDTIVLTVPAKDAHLPGVTTAKLCNEDGEFLNSYQNRKEIPGKYGMHKLQVRTMRMGSIVHVEGSPYGFRYGQNAFVPGDVRYAATKMLGVVSKRYQLMPSTPEKNWEAGDILLERVDLVLNFKLGSRAEVMDTITQIKHQFVAQNIHVNCYSGNVHWLPGKGREYSIRFYSKYEEMRHSRRPNEFSAFHRLLQECEGILRVEVQLRKDALHSLKLERADAWTAEAADMAFRKYMRRLPEVEIVNGPIDYELLQKLKPCLRPYYAVSKLGADLSKIFGKRSLQRHNKEYKQIRSMLDLEEAGQSAKPLHRMLRPGLALKHPPDWLRAAKLYPDEEK